VGWQRRPKNQTGLEEKPDQAGMDASGKGVTFFSMRGDVPGQKSDKESAVASPILGTREF